MRGAAMNVQRRVRGRPRRCDLNRDEVARLRDIVELSWRQIACEQARPFAASSYPLLNLRKALRCTKKQMRTVYDRLRLPESSPKPSQADRHVSIALANYQSSKKLRAKLDELSTNERTVHVFCTNR